MGFVDDEDDIQFIHQKNKYSKFMINALVSVSVVVFLVIVLRMYFKCLFKRRQAQGQTTTITISQTPNGVSVSQVESCPKNSLDPSVLTSLPIFLYKKKSDIHHDDIIECSICLSVIEDGELVRILPNCKHNFHVECIDKWFNCHSTCPICRTEADPRLLPEPRERVVRPPMDGGNLSIVVNLEGTSSSGNGASLGLSSFKRIILSRERSSRRLQAQSCSREGHVDDLENGTSRV